MGGAREVMDRITEALVNNDVEAMRALYATDATAETPDEGALRGADAIAPGWRSSPRPSRMRRTS